MIKIKIIITLIFLRKIFLLLYFFLFIQFFIYLYNDNYRVINDYLWYLCASNKNDEKSWVAFTIITISTITVMIITVYDNTNGYS